MRLHVGSKRVKALLKLLVRRGTCSMAFTLILSGEQYQELMNLVRPVSTCAEMENLVQDWSDAHSLEQ